MAAHRLVRVLAALNQREPQWQHRSTTQLLLVQESPAGGRQKSSPRRDSTSFFSKPGVPSFRKRTTSSTFPYGSSNTATGTTAPCGRKRSLSSASATTPATNTRTSSS